MAWEDEVVGLDVASAGVVVSDRIEKEAAGQVDLREALEASKLASHLYSSHPKEVPFLPTCPLRNRFRSIAALAFLYDFPN